MNQQNNHMRPVMFVGTGSDVGKSIIATAFCRILKQDGFSPAPFKAQNMALNSYATPEGFEIGRAQAVQAEAAGIPCHTDMNPLLLKPQSDHTSQVILNGKSIGNQHAYDYFRREGRETLRTAVYQAFDRLSSRYQPIVMEGAGSISEINLKQTDLANMSMAKYAQARVILVGDIDRGGVFASLYGSIMLLDDDERRLVKGIIINKFRGDLRLFEEGKKMIEELCCVPVLGVVPSYRNISIDEEDSVSISLKSRNAEKGKINIAVILLNHLSNFTDFNALEQDKRVHLFYTNNVEDIRQADIIILPGSKSTLSDLTEIRKNGVANAILQARRCGASVLGICGGYQMMGQEVRDPHHEEGECESLPGLGLLPVVTTITALKTTRQRRFRLIMPDAPQPSGSELYGYEIHQGQTVPKGGVPESPLAQFSDGTTDGYFADNRCMGSYLHGILDNKAFIDFLLRPYLQQNGEAHQQMDFHAFKEQQYDLLADHVRKSVDMKRFYQILHTHD